jgi:hypothetical protein
MDKRQKESCVVCFSRQLCSRELISSENFKYVPDLSQPCRNVYTLPSENVENVASSPVVRSRVLVGLNLVLRV